MTAAAIEDKILSYGYGTGGGSGNGDMLLGTAQNITADKEYQDSIKAKFGAGGDLEIYHDGTNSYVNNTTGKLFINNQTNDSDIIFRCDDGSGGMTDYMTIDGSDEIVRVHKPLWITEYITHIGDTNTFFGFSAADTFVVHAGASGHAELTITGSDATFAGDVSALRFHMNPGYAASNEYLILSKGQSQDGGILLKSKPTGGNAQNDWQILNHSTTGDLRFYAYGLAGFALTLDRENGNATFVGDVNTGDDLNVGDDVNIAGDQLTFTNDAASAYIRGADTLIIESDYDNDDGSSKPIYFYTNGTEMARMEATVATFAGDITITDISGTRGISRNNTGYNLQLMGGTDNTDGAFISLSGETRGGAANSYNGRIEIYSGGGGLANQAAALGDIIFGTKWNGGSSNILVLDSSTNNATFAGHVTITGGKDIFLADNGKTHYGAGNDLEVYHDGSNSYVVAKGTGDLILQQTTDNKDIIFQTDNGAGGVQTYFFLDGSAEQVEFNKSALWTDNDYIKLGTSGDFEMHHNGVDTIIGNQTGDLKIRQFANDKDIIFDCDDGSGGAAEYFRIDGGGELTYFSKHLQMADNVKFFAGSAGDLAIYHDGSFSRINADGTGDLIIAQKTADKDIIFANDDGSGGTTEYFRLDGSSVFNVFNKQVYLPDNVKTTFGDGSDLKIWHDGTDSVIQNETGNLEFQNRQDDGDIVFKSDDGSGGVETYFYLDGGNNNIKFVRDTNWIDNEKATFGSSGDLQILHNATNSYIQNYLGDLYINNWADNRDIIFQSDDGSGGVAEYFRVDGSSEAIIISKATQHGDNVKAYYGAGNDLQIYHDGSNSFIVDYGVGDMLHYYSNDWKVIKLGSGEVSIWAQTDAGVKLFYNNSLKLETTAYGAKTYYTPTSNTDGDAAGDIVYLGETTTVAGKIYYYTSSGAWELTDADAESTAKGMLGVALGTSSGANGMLLRGMVTLDHDPGTIADTLFLSTAAGAATATAPSGTGDIVRVIGYSLNSTNGQIYFNPDGAFVEVTAG
jgi:hypothetical protein